jgi:hypothetical protein
MKELLLTLVAAVVLIANSYAQVQNKNTEEDKSANCGGVERWDVKVLTDLKAGLVDFNPNSITVGELVTLVTPKPSSKMERYAGIEDKTYKVVCKITVKKNEADADYHLVLSDGTHTFIGEVPNPVCATAATSLQVDNYIAVRNFIDNYIPQSNNNNVNIPEVEVTGVAFIDPPHGQIGKAPNNIEFHPILDIHFTSLTAVADLEKNKVLKVSLSPNPAHGKVTVNVTSKIELLKNCSLKLFDLNANLIREYQLTVVGNNNNISESLDLQNIAKGIYIYRILNNGKGIYDGKVVVE